MRLTITPLIRPYSVIEGATVGEDCTVGPFTRLRPGAELVGDSHVGNFVEMKKARLGQGSKANHLTYLGDAEIGDRVNIGAGTITCNYDGANKFKTEIADDVFVGSDTQLIAPVKVGKGATIGAGATINRDVGEGELVITRAPARTSQRLEAPREEVILFCFDLFKGKAVSLPFSYLQQISAVCYRGALLSNKKLIAHS